MKSFKILVPFFFSCFFLTSCFDNSFGGAPVDEGLPQKLVFIHTTDTHGKYLPFWMEPNMFDRNMGLTSGNPPCWDLNYSGGGSYCNGSYNANTGKYQVYEDSHYVYYTKEELIEKGLLDALKRYKNIIVKFGRFIPNRNKHIDNILGVELHSDNQYGEIISEEV